MIQEKVNRNHDEISGETLLNPVTDIFETDNEYNMKFEMPGVSKSGIEITLEGNELEVRGNVENYNPESLNLKYSEYTSYGYYRRFKVGNDINRDNVNASLEDGVLNIVLQKTEEAKPKKIELQ